MKVELNWPVVALVIGIAALLLFRRPLAGLLERTEKIKDWLVAPRPQSLPNADEATDPKAVAIEQKRRIDALTEGFSSKLLLIREAAIVEDLQNHGLSVSTDTEKVLVKHLAGSQIVVGFERLFAVIYRSQVQALRWINGQPTGAARDDLEVLYERAKAQWPTMYEHYSLEQWTAFMVLQGLLTLEQSAEDEVVSLQITVFGREFLAFLVNDGRSDPSFG